MKKLLILMLVFVYFVFPDELWARTIAGVAKNLGKEATQIGYAVSVLGFAVGCIYLILGKQEATTKLTNTAFGLVLLTMTQSIVSMIINMGG